MNAGKSTTLLQSSYNYVERGMNPLLLTPNVDDRDGPGKIKSRIGIESDALRFASDANLFDLITAQLNDGPIHCIMVDEAQFLTRAQVFELGRVCDELKIPILAFGLRTDFQGEPFEGSKYLLAWADNLNEIKAICHCGRKATMVIRVDENGATIKSGDQIDIGGNERYVSMCRKHFNSEMYGTADI